MANENDFVQVVRFDVDDNALRAAIENMKKGVGDVNNAAGSKLSKNMEKAGKEAEKTAKATSLIAKTSKEATVQTDKLSKSFGGLAGAIKGAVAAYIGFQGISKMVGFGRSSIEAFKVQSRAERLLQFGMEQNGTASRFDELKKYAGGIQGRTMYGDEAMLTAASSWQSRIRGVENSKRMMDLVADFAAKSSGGGAVDANTMKSYAQQLMMALSGRAQTLKATVGDISAIEELNKLRQKGMKITEDMEIQALEKVLAPIKGAASTLANTDEGKIEQLGNLIGDLKEDVGRELLPVLADLAREVKRNLPTIKELFNSIGGMLKTFINTLKDNIGNISTFVQAFSDSLNLFAKAPFEIMAFVGAMKMFGPALMESRTAALESTAAFRVMGRTMSGIAKGGLMALTIWAIEKIAEAAKAGKQYLGEKSNQMDREHHYANFNEAMRHVNSATDFQKGLGLSASDIDEARSRMGSVPSGFDMNNVRDPRAAAMIAGLNGKQIQWMKYEFDKRSWKSKANSSMAAMNAVGSAGRSEMSIAEQVQKEMAGISKGDTNITNINYTNNIETNSDLMAKAIKENLRMLLTSNMNIITRSEGAKALAL